MRFIMQIINKSSRAGSNYLLFLYLVANYKDIYQHLIIIKLLNIHQ
jgi:hypothetical protein